jgi:type III secretion protein L
MDSKIIKAAAGADAADPKLVKKEAYTAVLDAVTILDTAREQARAILRDAEARAAETIQQARRRGEDEGLARYLAAIAEAQQSLEKLYSAAEGDLVRLAIGVARKIVGEELQASPDTVLKIVREALAAGRQARQVTVKVHPTSAAHVRKSMPDVQVVAVESVAPGGCVIESEFGIVDAQLETQLRVMERSLL